MWAALLAAAALDGAPPAELSARIAASAAAAQALQGPLDGSWILRDRRGRCVYLLQISEPAGGGPPQAAWRARGAPAPVAAMRRTGGRLSLVFDGARIVLRRRAPALWSGSILRRGRRAAVTLVRDR